MHLQMLRKNKRLISWRQESGVSDGHTKCQLDEMRLEHMMKILPSHCLRIDGEVQLVGGMGCQRSHLQLLYLA